MDSFSYSSEDVLNDLDPLSRALLDLSIQRDMNDAEIAQVLGTDEESVFEVRVGLLRNLAEKVAPEHAGDELPELQAAVAERLYPEDEAELAETPVEEKPEPEPEPEPESAPAPVAAKAQPAQSRRRSWLPVVIPILLVVAVVAVIVVAGSGNDDSGTKSKPTAAEPTATTEKTTTAETPPKPQPTPRRLTGFGSAGGTASLDGNTLTMTLKNLPPADGGTYTVWLYNSIIDAEKIGTVKNGKVDAKLPAGADKYRYVDVSLEPPDSNPNHSGQSVARVPLRKLQS